jgi:hypothetical protein
MEDQATIMACVAIYGAVLSTAHVIVSVLRAIWHWANHAILEPRVMRLNNGQDCLEVTVRNRGSSAIKIAKLGLCVGPRRKGTVIMIDEHLQSIERTTSFWTPIPLDCERLSGNATVSLERHDRTVLSCPVDPDELRDCWAVYVENGAGRRWYSAWLAWVPVMGFLLRRLRKNGRFLCDCSRVVQEHDKHQAEILEWEKTVHEGARESSGE